MRTRSAATISRDALPADEVRERLAGFCRADQHAGRGHRDRRVQCARLAPHRHCNDRRGIHGQRRDGSELDRTRRTGRAGCSCSTVRVTPAVACCGPRSRSWRVMFRHWDTRCIVWFRDPRRLRSRPPVRQHEPVLENEHYRVEFNPAGGAMTRLLVKSNQWEALQRTRQRRGPGGGPWRFVGAVQAARRWQSHRHEDAGGRAAARTGRVQQ